MKFLILSVNCPNKFFYFALVLKIAVVILNWNGIRLLERYLPSVVKFSGDSDIYVIDNASTDGSIAFLKKEYPNVGVVQNDSNGGFAKGYNDGLKHIGADIYCLLNSDVEVSPNWIHPIQEAFKLLENAAIIQPKILDLKRKTHFEYAGAAGGFIDGACMFIKQQVYWQLGGFDEAYFAHQEEIDLCWRAQNKGHQVFYVGKSHVFHLGGSTLSNMNPKKTFLNFRNSLFTIVKNLPRKKAFLIIMTRLLLDGIAGLRFIFQLKFAHCFAIIRAHINFYFNFRAMYAKREKANFILNYHATKSIVWSYFVNQVKNFNILIKD